MDEEMSEYGHREERKAKEKGIERGEDRRKSLFQNVTFFVVNNRLEVTDILSSSRSRLDFSPS